MALIQNSVPSGRIRRIILKQRAQSLSRSSRTVWSRNMHFGKKNSVLVGLLGALRLLGGFPYAFKSTEDGKRIKIKKSIAAILWTCLIVSALVTLSLSSLANAPTRESMTENWTTHIVNYLTYGSSALLFLYLALRSSKLASILRNLSRINVNAKWSLVDRADFIHGMCFLGVAVGILFCTYCSVRDFAARLRDGSESLFYHIPVTVLDPFIEVTSITFGLLMYYILKVVGLEAMDVIMTSSAHELHHPNNRSVSSCQRHKRVIPDVRSRRTREFGIFIICASCTFLASHLFSSLSSPSLTPVHELVHFTLMSKLKF